MLGGKGEGIKQKQKTHRHRQQYGNYQREGEKVEGKGGEMVMEGDLTLDGEHTIQYTDDVLQNCALEICIIILTNVTPINSKIF